MDEMISPISNQILPESIEERLELYKKRNELEEQNIQYKIIKQRFLNYRLLSATVKLDKKVIPSYILFYSTLRNKRMNGRVDFEKDSVAYLNRDEVKVISLSKVNMYLNTNYNTTKDMIYNSPSIELELELREKITGSKYDISTIVVLDDIQTGKYEIQIDSKLYEDVKEVIL